MLTFLAVAAAGADAAQAVVENAPAAVATPLTPERVAIAALLAAIAMSSVVIGAWLGLTFKASDKLIANILAFGSGALVNALAVDLAFGTTQHLVNSGVPNIRAWAIVAGGFIAGGLIYYICNKLVDKFGGSARHKTNARRHAMDKKREEVSELLGRLAKNVVFRSLPPSEIDHILPFVREFSAEKGEVIYKIGQEPCALYLIDEGKVGIYVEVHHGADPDKRISESHEGDVFGEMAIVSHTTRTNTAIAETAIKGMMIEKDDFEHLMEDSPKIREVITKLAEHHTLESIHNQADVMDAAEWEEMAADSMKRLHSGEIHQALEAHGGGSPLAIWIGNILDAIPGSLVIGATYMSIKTFNPTLLIAIFLANLPEAMASANTMRHAGYSKAKIYGLWGSLVLIGAVCAAIGNIALPDAPIEFLAICEAVSGGAILALVAQVMFPHAYEEGGDSVGLTTIAGFAIAFLLSALEIVGISH
jgi:CRP-like cAMP-binding protein